MLVCAAACLPLMREVDSPLGEGAVKKRIFIFVSSINKFTAGVNPRPTASPVTLIFRYAQFFYSNAVLGANRRELAPVGLVGQVAVDRSCQPEAPGYGQDLPGGIGRFLTCQVHHRRGDLLRQAHPP